ncbi:MAG: GAF domain-containing protein, partial [Anaerolineae bacterium]
MKDEYKAKEQLVTELAELRRRLAGLEALEAEHKRAEEALQRKARQQEQLIETARHLTASLDVKEVLTRIGVGAKEILSTHGCAIYLLEEDGKTLTPVVAIASSYKEEILSTPLDIEASFTGQAVKTRQGLIFNDAGTDFSGQQIPGTPEEEKEHIIVAPFVADDEVLGAMCLNRIEALFSEEDLALAETFATYAVTALKNAQAHRDLQREVEDRRRAEESLRKRTEEIELLYEAGQQLSQTLDIDTIYNQLHALVFGIMDCDALIVSSFDPEDKLIRCAFAIIEGNQQDVSHLPPLPLNPEEQGTQSLTIHTGKSLLIRDYHAQVETSKKAYYIEEEKVVDHDKTPDDAAVTRSGLVVPVKLEGQVVAVIQVMSYRLDAYTEDDLRILEALAYQIAVASNNALLYQQAQDEIVQRKRAEEERERLLVQIREQAQRVQQIIDTVPEGVLLLDADGQVILANPVGEKDLAVLAGDSVGDTLTHLGDRPLAELLTSPPKGLWHEVATAGPSPRTFEIIARCIETGPTPSGACPATASTRGGEPVEGACPEPVEGWVLVIRDVTQEREIERRIQQQERLATVG